MVIVLVCLGWSALAVLLALVVGAGVRLADARAEADAWRVPLVADVEPDRVPGPVPLVDRLDPSIPLV